MHCPALYNDKFLGRCICLIALTQHLPGTAGNSRGHSPANYPRYHPVIPLGVGEQQLQRTGALAISADPDEILHCETFHLTLVCLSKYLNQPVYRFLV